MADKAEPASNGTPPSLVYVDTDQPGITRHRRGKGFAYRAPDGHWLSSKNALDQLDLQRIRSLAIPPAYHDVWICPDARGHLQATAKDAKGRRQYCYHPAWSAEREADKFSRMAEFGQALPILRAQTHQDLPPQIKGASPQKHQLLAALVRLLDKTHIRVGNSVYAKDNQSYGLTTLLNRHARIDGARITLQFRGKSGVWHNVRLEDIRVAHIVRKCQELPGQDLFTYQDESGVIHRIGSTEVNQYIRETTQRDFSAKDFRTWHATVHAWSLLRSSSDLRVVDVVKTVAKALGNTPTVCRKSYIHPLVLRCAVEGQWPPLSPDAEQSSDPQLSEDEASLLAFLNEAERHGLSLHQPAPVSLRKTSTRRLRARP